MKEGGERLRGGEGEEGVTPGGGGGQKAGMKRRHEEEEASPTKKLVDLMTDYQSL